MITKRINMEKLTSKDIEQRYKEYVEETNNNKENKHEKT